MYILKVEAGFEAAHRLSEYNGPCRRLHGHSYVVQATWKMAVLDAGGMAIDLVILKKLLRNVLSRFDHQSLNTVMTNVPTAENLAKVIFNYLRDESYGGCLAQVAVEETRDTCVTYREELVINKEPTRIPHRGD